ncbi:hypothetical protein ACINNAV21_1757 [Acinetobacter baumannii Naval-21]|nr:hypothetical protein ACINNAV21_1757 [Acinetobacter baumannii Naval-21]KLT82044.1 hypothetical protein T632_1992 [Acinetobacter baumannii MRSN 4106]KLT88607.1 hypothetical protein T629_2136 [Acinetobacter baumannii MRSN 3405]KLT93720.1 hypothetical protein T631_2105 [Acinetobacter baumannii MRSN 3942]
MSYLFLSCTEEINNNHQTHSQQIYTAQVITTGTYKTFNKTIKCN